MPGSINDIERDLHEINGIYQDLNAAVQRQGGVLDTIENNMERTDTAVEASQENLTLANQHAGEAQSTRWTLYGIIGAILLALGLK
jgi:t-SNARE complex subunit (syntaxin)